MKRLPRRIRIMGQEFKVRRPKKLSMVGKESNLACIDTGYFVIEVNKIASGKAAWDGLCHEWAHGVMAVTGIDQKIGEKLQETIAQSFGSALREFCEQQGLKLE